ncbi:hypothetical protein P43SY_003254 [Pythium insidiosum]|uniref:B box-type domain-containing protein n=1 Tax=Pythium insidiosum TaxID=114742 RepID=A0AAD5L8M6_PYTIN|nr:hypothetical protein P43SY_003254 [Pythium insidiosum]
MVPRPSDEAIDPRCLCGESACKRCGDCGLAYCAGCCARRHRLGAFIRHEIEELPCKQLPAHNADDENSSRPRSPSPSLEERSGRKDDASLHCEDCGGRPATLRCDACELRFCDSCAVDVHRVGKLQVHVVRGCFVRLKKGSDSTTSNQDERDDETTWPQQHASESSNQDEVHTVDPVDLVGVDELLQDAGDDRSLERRENGGCTALPDAENDSEVDLADPDQEKSPTPPSKSESFGLWGGWSARSFHDRSISLDASDDWRAFESLSIDKQPLSPPTRLSDELPLTSIKESFHSLAFASTASTVFGPLATSRDDFILSGVVFCTFFELKAAIAAVKLWLISGEDKRTTLMIRNIPNKYTQQMLLSEINARHHGKYDFFYLPIDFKNKCNMGYAFINFIDAESIVPFYEEFDSQKWTNFNSEKES